MKGQKRYPRTLVLLLLMVLSSVGIVGQLDSRLNIGGGEWDSELALSPSIEPVDLALVSDEVTAEVGEDFPEPETTTTENPKKDEAITSTSPKSTLAAVTAETLAVSGVSDSLTASGNLDTVTGVVREPIVVVQEKPKPVERPTVLVHKVAAGETLWDIARSYGITVDTILSANDIKNSNRIRIGQELKILSVKGVLHTVAVGESVWEIAERYKVAMEEIVSVNKISDPATIQPRSQLVIPGATKLLIKDALVVNGQLQKAFEWPARARISSQFGSRWGSMHNGLDIAVNTGTPVLAAADGRVTWAGPNGTYGILVRIDHGNQVETRYAHNSRVAVKVGDKVERGQIIAYSGNTGRSTGPHLHFEIRYKGQAVDPQKYLR